MLGYTRVSTAAQDAQLRMDSLLSAGVQRRDIFSDVTSGSRAAVERPGMKKLLKYAEAGDTLMVWRVDRPGRSLIDVLNTVNLLQGRGVALRSLSDGIDPEQGPAQVEHAGYLGGLRTRVDNREGECRHCRRESERNQVRPAIGLCSSDRRETGNCGAGTGEGAHGSRSCPIGWLEPGDAVPAQAVYGGHVSDIPNMRRQVRSPLLSELVFFWFGQPSFLLHQAEGP